MHSLSVAPSSDERAIADLPPVDCESSVRFETVAAVAASRASTLPDGGWIVCAPVSGA